LAFFSLCSGGPSEHLQAAHATMSPIFHAILYADFVPQQFALHMLLSAVALSTPPFAVHRRATSALTVVDYRIPEYYIFNMLLLLFSPATFRTLPSIRHLAIPLQNSPA
jgi:hypothetical protein